MQSLAARPILASMTVTIRCPNGHTQQYELGATDWEVQLARDTVTFQCATCRVSWKATVGDQEVLRREVAIAHGPDPRD